MMDNRSFRLNFEVMLLTVDSEFAGLVEHMLNEDFAQAQFVDDFNFQSRHRGYQASCRGA